MCGLALALAALARRMLRVVMTAQPKKQPTPEEDTKEKLKHLHLRCNDCRRTPESTRDTDAFGHERRLTM